MRIHHIEIEGYRALRNVALDLEPLTVLIGPNGCGKSTFLDSFVLLAEAMGDALGRATIARGGFSRMLSQGHGDTLRIRVESEPLPWGRNRGDGESPVVYELDLRQSGTGYAVYGEQLSQARDHATGVPFRYLQRTAGHTAYFDASAGRLAPPDWAILPDEAALARVARNDEAEFFRASLAGTRAYAPIGLDARSTLRQPQTMQPGIVVPDPTGADLYSALYRLRMDDEATYGRLMDTLAAGFPNFKKLEFPIVAGGTVALAWYETGTDGPLYANELSAGTLRFLHIATMLLSPLPPPLLLLDEPEASFHPELLLLLAELLKDAAERTQIVVATHSGPLIRWLEPKHVVTADRTEEGTTLTRGDRQNLDKWLEDYGLDELWQLKILGARP